MKSGANSVRAGRVDWRSALLRARFSDAQDSAGDQDTLKVGVKEIQPGW